MYLHDEVKKQIQFIFVETIDDVLDASLEPKPNGRKHKKNPKTDDEAGN